MTASTPSTTRMMPSIRKSFQCSVKVLATASRNASNDWFVICASLQLIVSVAIFVAATAEYKFGIILPVTSIDLRRGITAPERPAALELIASPRMLKLEDDRHAKKILDDQIGGRKSSAGIALESPANLGMIGAADTQGGYVLTEIPMTGPALPPMQSSESPSVSPRYGIG